MFSNILLAIDLDAPGSWTRALEVCEALVRAFQGRLTLCTIVSEGTAAREAQWSPIAYRELIEAARVRLLGIARISPPAAVEVGCGPVHVELLAVAERIGADLIVLSSHEPALKDYVLRSNARRIAGGASQSVLVVRRPAAAAASD